MKPIDIIRHALLALALTLPFTTNAQMVPPNDRVRIQVTVVSDNDRKDIKGSSSDTVMQNKMLNIQISGKPKIPETRVIKWVAYGRNLKSNDVKMLGSGEIKLDLVNNQQTAESKRLSTTYTPTHTEVSKSRKGGHSSGRSSGRSAPRAKRIDATGVKFAGYSVQVIDGGTVVGEMSDPESIGKPK